MRPGLWGRLLVLGSILAALTGTEIPWGAGPVELVVLWDRSASMPRSWQRRAWKDLAREVQGLPAGSRLVLLPFATVPAAEAQVLDPHALPGIPPAREPLDPGASDPGAALARAWSLAGGDLPRRVLLVSDGLATRGHLERVLRQAPPGPPLAWWSPPPVPARPWISGVRPLGEAVEGRPILVAVSLSGDLDEVRLRIQVDDGEPLVSVPAGNPVLVRLPGQEAGLHRLRLSLMRDGRVLAGRLGFVQVGGRRPILWVSRGAPGPASEALAAGGWPVRRARPADLDAAHLEGIGLLVLEDVPADDLSPGFVAGLKAAVSRRGLGLLVLGGAHAFSLGGYRHAPLEALLPLLSEPRQPQPPASLLFLVDTSGSMGRRPSPQAPSRLALARRALVETAAVLSPGDRVGLITFAARPRRRLPLGRYGDPAAALASAWDEGAGGGTRLAPALAEALQELAAVEPDPARRWLILISDGFLDTTGDLERARRARQGREGRILALLVGREAREGAIGQVLDGPGDVLLRVAEVAHLPRLLRTQIERLQAPVRSGPVRPRPAAGAAAWLSALPIPWPLLDAYAPTRARPQARVSLTTPGGDPLLAVQSLGAGRVAALPAGLDAWARAWPSWPGWGAFLGGLVDRLEGRPRGMRLRPLEARRGVAFELEAEGQEGWYLGQAPRALVTDPLGRDLAVEVEALAPGAFRLRIPTRLAGRYALDVDLEGRHLHRVFQYLPHDELHPPPGADTPLREGLARGRVRPWRPGLDLALPRRRLALAPWLIGLALLAWLALLAVERLPLPRRPS